MQFGPGAGGAVNGEDHSPHSVKESRAALVKDLHLESLHPLSDSLSEMEKLEFEVEKLSAEVDRLTTVVEEHGHVKDTDITLNGTELGTVKVKLLEEKIALANAERTYKTALHKEAAKELQKINNELDVQELVLADMNNYESDEEVREFFQGADRRTQTQTIENLRAKVEDIKNEQARLERDIEATPKSH